MARGCGEADTLLFLSGATGWPVEEVAKAGAGPKMFQLYHHGDRGWVAELLARVEAAGYQAGCLTLDGQGPGRRGGATGNRLNPRARVRRAPRRSASRWTSRSWADASATS